MGGVDLHAASTPPAAKRATVDRKNDECGMGGVVGGETTGARPMTGRCAEHADPMTVR